MSSFPEDTATQRPSKRVRIAIEPQVVGNVESLSDQERLKSWYSSTEFAASKDSVKELCRSYRQSRRYSDCLTQAYNTACGLADQHECFQKREENPVAMGTDLPDKGLAKWMQGPRGLEGYSSRLHAMRRQRHFQDARHAVFLEQARQNLSATKDDTMLARQAERSSRRARSFAFLLGRADAWAASQNNDDGDEKRRKSESVEEASEQDAKGDGKPEEGTVNPPA